MAEKEDKKVKKHRVDRGASDDWEALQMILADNPALKQRVFHRLRALKRLADDRSAKKGVMISEEQYRKITEKERRG